VFPSHHSSPPSARRVQRRHFRLHRLQLESCGLRQRRHLQLLLHPHDLNRCLCSRRVHMSLPPNTTASTSPVLLRLLRPSTPSSNVPPSPSPCSPPAAKSALKPCHISICRWHSCNKHLCVLLSILRARSGFVALTSWEESVSYVRPSPPAQARPSAWLPIHETNARFAELVPLHINEAYTDHRGLIDVVAEMLVL
jgi:hypothetical protein